MQRCGRRIHEDLKKRFCKPGFTVGYGRCRKQERGFFSAAFLPPRRAQSLYSSTMFFCPVNSADPRVEIASIKLGKVAHLSSHMASMDVHMTEHESNRLAGCKLSKGDQAGGLSSQENADMEIHNGFSQANMAEVLDVHHSNTLTSLKCNFEQDSRKTTSDDEKDVEVGFKCDNGEDDMQTVLNQRELSGCSKPVLTSHDEEVIQDICTLLDSQGWDANTEEFLSKTYAPHLPHTIVAMVINRQTGLPVAKSFFEWACRQVGHDAYSYHALLLKLGQNTQFDEMWDVLNRMKDAGCQVSETTFCILIKAYGDKHMPDMSVTAFQRINDYGVVAGTHAFTMLISVFFKLKLTNEVHLCYRKMIVDGVNIDIHLFSTLIRGFGIMGNMSDAQACFNMMLSYTMKPDRSTFNSLIEGFCACNAMQSAMTTFAALEKRGIQPNAYTFNVIIKAFCQDGKLKDAMKFFLDMKERDNAQPNQATYNILLQGLLAREELSRAIDFFKQMEKEGFVDSRSYILLSNKLRQMKQTQELLDLLRGIFASHGVSNTDVCNALIYNLSHLDALDEAEDFFREMVTAQTCPSIPSYTNMISCYCRAEKLEAAIELLAELKGRDCVPSAFCYTPIITLLLRMDRAVDALRYVQEMQDLGLEVTCVTYNYLLKVMCKQGMIENAVKVCDIMMARWFTVSADTLFELMKCLIKLQSVEVAMSHFRRLYKQKALPQCKAVSQALAVMNLWCEEKHRVIFVRQ